MTRSLPLDLERLEELLDVHGADLERWPEALQSPARELLASSSEAQLLLVRAQRLAAVLNAVPDVLPSAELSARIAALPARRPQGWAAWWPFGNPLAPLLAWGAAAAFGLFVGSGWVPGVEPLTDAATANGAAELTRGNADQEHADEEHASAGDVDDQGTDEASVDELDGDDWSDLDLALGLGSEWEDEP